MADLQLRIMGEDNASAAFSGVSQAARAAGGILLDFYKDSLKAFMEADKAQRQLAVVARDLTGAFRQQADAIADSLGLQGELVMGVQTMLLRYGEAPAAVEATTKAVLDYAAATGTDAQTATEALTRGVESGTGNFKGLGIAIQATGDKTKDLSAATAELAKKYGGAAAADAASLSGSIRGAQEAFGGLEEAFGSFLATIGEKTGGIAALTSALQEMGKAADFAAKFYEKGGLAGIKQSVEAFFSGDNDKIVAAKRGMEQLLEDVEVETLSEAAINRQKIQRAKKGSGSARIGGGAGAAADAVVDSPGYRLKERDFIDPTDAADADFNKAILGSAAYVKDLNQRRLAVADGEASIWKVVSDAADKGAAEAAAKTKQWADAGAAIGGAFADAVSSSIQKLSSGQEMDLGETIGDILATVLQVAGTAIGTVYGGPMGGAVGGALGGIAGSGVRALSRRSDGGVTINTMDGQSAREFFERDGGRAFYNAARTGRGALGNL